MRSADHIIWFEDNIRWFETIELKDMSREVPDCPGWTVETVINHLSKGVGLGYAKAITSPPDANLGEVFADLGWPEADPIGSDSQERLSSNMQDCLETFRSKPETTPCFTYAGPGVASFWPLRAAVETAIHRFDVEVALKGKPLPLSSDRALQAIQETFDFTYPMAAMLIGQPNGRLELEVDGSDTTLLLGLANLTAY